VAGYVLIALLAQEIRDGKGRGISTSRTGNIYKFLLREPHTIITQLARAITRNVVTVDESLPIALALLSVVFEAEDTHDLRISPDDADLVWSQLPWLGAAVEPWDDSSNSRHRWSERLGWPPIVEDEINDDGFAEVAPSDEAETWPSLRPILATDFDRQARLFSRVPRETIDALLDSNVGTRTDLPLSVDAEWDAVIRNIAPLVSDEGSLAIKNWGLEHAAVIQSALGRLVSHPCQGVLSQYAVRAMSPYSTTHDQWFFHNVIALATDLTTERDRGGLVAAALIDACSLSSQWVGYALLLALSVHPYSRLDN